MRTVEYRGAFRQPCCCYLSVTTSTARRSTGPPVLNRSPYGYRKMKMIRVEKFHLGLVLRLLNFLEQWSGRGEARLRWVLK